jgi:hypothetical protein
MKPHFEGAKFMKQIFRHGQNSFFGCALLVALLFAASSAFAQMRVANFSTGKAGTKSYEHLSFYVNDGARGDITYAYGKAGRSGEEITLKYLDKDKLNGAAAFKIALPNNMVLYVIPQKTYLKIVDGKGKYNKIFRWEYEGPVNGIGTWCSSCTQNGKESVALIRKYFF